MKVFLAGIMQGSHRRMRLHPQQWRARIREAFARHCPRAEVYCHLEANPDSVGYELDDIVRTLAEGNRLAAASDVVVCWLPAASMGTAVEMHEAARAGAAVVAITPMAANWVVRAYSDCILPDLAALERFLAEGGLTELVERKRRDRPGAP